MELASNGSDVLERETPGVVFDCMVYLQAAVRDTCPAFACLEMAEAGRCALFLSREVLAEVRDVLNRPQIRRKFPILTDEHIAEFLKRVTDVAIMITNTPSVFRFDRDPKDEPYINLAIITGAKYIVSRDNDLLDLMTAQDSGSRAFRARFPNLQVIDPVSLLREIRANDGRG